MVPHTCSTVCSNQTGEGQNVWCPARYTSRPCKPKPSDSLLFWFVYSCTLWAFNIFWNSLVADLTMAKCYSVLHPFSRVEVLWTYAFFSTFAMRINLKAEPPWFEFLVIFDFLHLGIKVFEFNFFENRHRRQKRFSQNERRRADVQKSASNF